MEWWGGNWNGNGKERFFEISVSVEWCEIRDCVVVSVRWLPDTTLKIISNAKGVHVTEIVGFRKRFSKGLYQQSNP